MVMGDDSCLRGRGFESQNCMQEMTFFTLIWCKNCIVCLKRPKINRKRGRGWLIKKIFAKKSPDGYFGTMVLWYIRWNMSRKNHLQLVSWAQIFSVMLQYLRIPVVRLLSQQMALPSPLMLWHSNELLSFQCSYRSEPHPEPTKYLSAMRSPIRS